MNSDLSSQSDDLFREQMYLLNHLLNLRLGGCTSNNVGIYNMPWCVWISYIGVIDGTIVKT
jgi:hypothetical protein